MVAHQEHWYSIFNGNKNMIKYLLSFHNENTNAIKYNKDVLLNFTIKNTDDCQILIQGFKI